MHAQKVLENIMKYIEKHVLREQNQNWWSIHAKFRETCIYLCCALNLFFQFSLIIITSQSQVSPRRSNSLWF